MTDFSPTDEQIAIQDAAKAGGNLFIPAYAGCSKTTSLALAGKQIQAPGLALAFNVRIKKELEPRFAQNWAVKTLNGLGHGVWQRHIGRKVEIDERKLGKLVSAAGRQRKIDLTSEQWDQVRRLVTLAMSEGLAAEGGLVPDTAEQWESMAADLWVVEDDRPLVCDLAQDVLAQSVEMAKQGIISFDDQIYCPTILAPPGTWPRYPVVMVDESQDLNRLNLKMLELCSGRADGRLIAVGDSKQSIYGFRGAMSNSMERVRSIKPQWTQLPLTMTFRCPKVVVERQQGHAPGFRAFHSNLLGSFDRWHHADDLEEEKKMDGCWGWQEIQTLAAGGTCAILCRNNAPLLSLAFKLLRQNVGCYFAGRDIGKGLAALSRKLAPADDVPAAAIAGLVTDWIERESALLRANKREEQIAGVEDRGECLLAILSGCQAHDSRGLRDAIGKLFARESGIVVLSSIHRAKGLEWDLVVHLDPWRIPSRQAKREGGEALRQERNLLYVLETRTRNVLREANLEDFR